MKFLSITLSFLVVFQVYIPPAHAQAMPTELNIVVVEGEGAINNVRQRVGREPMIRVEDENHKPIAGAAVVFTLPTEGATGGFGNGAKTLTVMTDSEGQAAAKGLKLNQVSGKLPIHVTVSYRGLSARTTITQFNEGIPGAKANSGGGHGVLIGVLVGIAAAAGGGAYFATRQSKTSAVTPTPTGPTAIGITVGTGTIVGGH